MKALKYTPMVALKQRAIGALLNEAVTLLVEALAKQGEDIPADIIRRDLWEFAVFSTRAQFEAGEIDFEIAKANDSAEAVAAKYLAFLASQRSALITQSWTAISLLDSDLPSDVTSAPDSSTETDKSK
jgi:hypothetical protein